VVILHWSRVSDVCAVASFACVTACMRLSVAAYWLLIGKIARSFGSRSHKPPHMSKPR
jgi:hypothetical protein